MTVDVEVPPWLSHSQCSSLIGESCPASYWFERVLGKPSIPGWAALGGSALHAASEDWDRLLLETGEANTDPSALAGMFGMSFDIEIQKTKDHTPYPMEEWHRSGRQSAKNGPAGGPNKKDEAWWREYGPLMLASWVNWRLTSGWEIAFIQSTAANTPDGAVVVESGILGIEVPFEVEMGGVPVKGYIDRVFERDGEFLVVDLKSGREPDYTSQLGTYRVGMMRQYGIDPRWGAYWLGGTGLSTSFTDLRERWPEERVDRRFATARRRQLAGEFDCSGCWICKQGGIRDYVANSGGSKAHTVPQPWMVGTVTVAERR